MPITESNKSIWTTSDGKVHAVYSEAVMHENVLGNAEQVEAYLDTLKGKNRKPITDRARAAQRNSIMGFLAWDIRRMHPPETIEDAMAKEDVHVLP